MRKKLAVFGLSLSVAVASVVPAFASNDNIYYSFTMPSKRKAVYAGGKGRYRQTKRTTNPWKVKMMYSAEGTGTKAFYWIANASSKSKVTAGMTVTQGSHERRQEPYAAANQNWVRLAVKNNNNTAKTYYVSGVWDEEID